MLLKDRFFFRFYIKSEFVRDRYTIRDFIFNCQKGGSFKIKYKNNIIKFEEEYENNNLILTFKSLNNKSDCIVLLYDKKEKIMNIERIDTSEKCLNNNNGKDLMNIIVKTIHKYKSRWNLKAIYVSDHSYLLCNNEKIWLSNLSLLQYGNTWYGRYGFIPVNLEDRIKLKKNLKILNKNNIKKLKKILINLNLKIYLNNYIKSENIDKSLMLESKIGLMEFMKYISIELIENKKCKELNNLIDKIFKKLELYEMNNKQYFIEF